MNDLVIVSLFCAVLGIVGVAILGGLVAFLIPRTKLSPLDSPEVTTTIESQAVFDGSRAWAKLEPNGREVFFPRADARAIYEVTLTGVIRRDSGRLVDAFHQTDSNGNFSHGVDWLRINGRQLGYCDFEIVASERCEHRYVIRVVNSVERLTLALDPGWGNALSVGVLTAEVTVLPPGTLMARERREIERKQVQDEKKREEARQEEVSEAAEFAQVIKTLTLRAETERNWRDPEFRQKFTRVHYKDLIEHQAEIRKEARQFLEQDRLVGYFRRHNPAVAETILGRFHALLAAEHLALDNAIATAEEPPPKVVEPPKPKLSAEQVKALKVRRQQIQLGDKVALAMNRVATIEDVKANVRDQFGHLGEDEQDRIIQEILDEVEDEKDQNGKTF